MRESALLVHLTLIVRLHPRAQPSQSARMPVTAVQERAAACRGALSQHLLPLPTSAPHPHAAQSTQSSTAIEFISPRSSKNVSTPAACSRVSSVYFVEVASILFAAPLCGQQLQQTHVNCTRMNVPAYFLERLVPRKCDLSGSGPLPNHIYIVASVLAGP